MLNHVMIGSNDIERPKRFYDAVLGVLGVVQYVPFYARKLFDPKGSGYIPNN